ncbi:MAG: BLUF domain-containing protein [Rhizobacter sp.]
MSPSTPSLYRFLYVSELAPAMPSNVVGQILRQSREHNHQRQFTGALLFDGERFCQLLEGESAATLALMSNIERDPRHCRMNVIFHAVADQPRLMKLWQCGYCEHGSFDVVETAGLIDPADAISAFMRLLKTSEMST